MHPPPAPPRRVAALAALAVLALLAAAAAPALGASTFDLRGTWEVRVYVGASLNNVQYWRLDQGDPGAGTFSGTTATTQAGSPFGTMTATADGVALSAVNPYTGGGYTARFTGTVGAGGTTMSGTWTANGGTSANNWTGTLVGATAPRRPSAVRVTCDRGPEPASPSRCTATVQDGGAAPPVTPTGRVEWSATAGGVAPAACDLAAVPGTPGWASCAVTFTPGPEGTPAGTAVPVTARYAGDAAFAGSEGRHEATGPEPATPVTPAQVVCIGNQVGACEGVLPPPGPVTTCVGNQIGACNGFGPGPSPLQVCVANVAGACPGFAAGAVLAGVWDGSAFVEVQVACPGAQGATSRPRRAHETPPGARCTVRTTLKALERDILRVRDDLFGEWLGLVRVVDGAIARAPAVVRDGGGNALRTLLSPAERARIDRYNATQRDFLAFARQAVRSGMAPDLRNAKVSPPVDVSWTIRHWRSSGYHHYTGNLPPGPIGDQAVRRARGVVLAGATATLPAGARRTARVRLTGAGRALLGLAARLGAGRVRLRMTVAITSSAGAFAPSSAERQVALRLGGRAAGRR